MLKGCGAMRLKKPGMLMRGLISDDRRLVLQLSPAYPEPIKSTVSVFRTQDP
jgi:hypothetical protein